MKIQAPDVDKETIFCVEASLFVAAGKNRYSREMRICGYHCGAESYMSHLHALSTASITQSSCAQCSVARCLCSRPLCSLPRIVPSLTGTMSLTYPMKSYSSPRLKFRRSGKKDHAVLPSSVAGRERQGTPIRFFLMVSCSDAVWTRTMDTVCVMTIVIHHCQCDMTHASWGP